jgi:hypothetical protein
MYYLEAAFCLIWLGALCTYLASASQQLLPTPLSKKRCWTLLPLSVVTSSYLLNMEYALVTSILICFSLLMMLWIGLILIAGHWRLKLIPVALVGAATLLLIAQLGGV